MNRFRENWRIAGDKTLLLRTKDLLELFRPHSGPIFGLAAPCRSSRYVATISPMTASDQLQDFIRWTNSNVVKEIETWVKALGHYDNNEFEESLNAFSEIADTSKILFNCGVIQATLGEHERAVSTRRGAVVLLGSSRNSAPRSLECMLQA